MATISGIRGMLLEEAILYLLRVSGYRTVEERDPHDKTLEGDPYSGLKVRGRGGIHQIDAIADLMIVPPFTYAQRLLLEAKCYADGRPVNLEIIRNAVGVLKDVGEYWVARESVPSKARYHYHYALFSASNYTKDAEKYAFAHDVYLIPLAQCRFIQPIIDSIRQVNFRTFGARVSNEKIEIPMTALRRGIRARIRNGGSDVFNRALIDYQDAFSILVHFCEECRKVDKGLIAMIAGRFPILLVPDPSFNFNPIRDSYNVSIHWKHEKRERGWYLRSRQSNEILFSFDLPIEIFKYYSEHNMLSPQRALDLKEDILTEIQAIATVDNRVQLVRFRLDREWLSTVRETIEQIRRE